MSALGTFALGTSPLGGMVVHDLPVVVVTAPTGTVTTGGPVLEVTWDYSQAQGDVQAEYRVELTNDADTVTYYDSGWLLGAVTTHDVNLTEEGVPEDTTDISVRVSVRSEEGHVWYDVSPLQAFAIEWGVVTCTITYPPDGAVINTATMTVTWSFSSTRAKTQSAYRVRLLSESGTQLFDSGWVAGAGTSYALPFTFSDGSSYQVGVQLANTEGVRS